LRLAVEADSATTFADPKMRERRSLLIKNLTEPLLCGYVMHKTSPVCKSIRSDSEGARVWCKVMRVHDCEGLCHVLLSKTHHVQ
jgi:hypothetical protein